MEHKSFIISSEKDQKFYILTALQNLEELFLFQFELTSILTLFWCDFNHTISGVYNYANIS